MSLSNLFGWSISRESTFEACRRRYYFHYYLSWGGWNSSSPGASREAYRLKRLVSLALWRGQLVHYVATKVLASLRKKGRIPAFGDVRDYTIERFRRQYDFSRRKLYLTVPKKKGKRLNIDWLALFEHEYDRDPGEEKIEGTLGECVEGIRGLIESPILGDIAGTDPSHWVIENIDMAEFAQVFRFEGARVFAKTDFIFRGNDGSFNIVDWKTHRSAVGGEDEKWGAGVQLGVYGYYAARVLGEPLESIRLYEVNLLDEGRSIEHGIDGENVDTFCRHIRKGIEKLSSVLTDNDIVRNEPGPPSLFPKSVSGLCRYCNFYRICIENPVLE